MVGFKPDKKKEKKEVAVEDLGPCFICGTEASHLARNCPESVNKRSRKVPIAVYIDSKSDVSVLEK